MFWKFHWGPIDKSMARTQFVSPKYTYPLIYPVDQAPYIKRSKTCDQIIHPLGAE